MICHVIDKRQSFTGCYTIENRSKVVLTGLSKDVRLPASFSVVRNRGYSRQLLLLSPTQWWNSFCLDVHYASLLVLSQSNEVQAHRAHNRSKLSRELLSSLRSSICLHVSSQPGLVTSFSNVADNLIRTIEKRIFDGGPVLMG